MIRGFYTAVSGLIASAARQSIVADNVANVNTPGFRQSRSSQASFELELRRSGGGDLGPLATATTCTGPAIDRSTGPIEPTGVPTDLAIDGDGAFTVRLPDGRLAYTRAGDFVVDAAGTLTTRAGHAVVATDGRPIVLADGAATFTVAPDGTIVGTDRRLAVVPWPAADAGPGAVRRLGEGLFTFAAPPAGGDGSAVGSVRQRALERSNVDLVTAMTELVGFQRSLALNGRSLRIQDETIAEATQLGRLR